MATLRDIKRRITAVKNTRKITSAMKMVSAAKLRRAQTATEQARPYVGKLENMLGNLISAAGSDYYHPLQRKAEEVKSIAMIVIASDRGLCGSFNNNLFRVTMDYIRGNLKKQYPNAKVSVIPVGQRTCYFFRKRELPVIKEFAGVFNNLNFSVAKDIIECVHDPFINGEIDKVQIYFNEFLNVISQKPKLTSLLPVDPETAAEDESHSSTDYIFEPDRKGILDTLMPKYVDIEVWRALLESHAAEHAARMMAMDAATNNASDLISHLELVYNKARQAAITKEMLEIVGGAEALRKS